MSVQNSEPGRSNEFTGLPTVRLWSDRRRLRVLGMGAAVPGPPLTTTELLDRVDRRFGLNVSRCGSKIAGRMGIKTRHFCRDFEQRHEAPRRGETNPDLAAAAVRSALDDAGLELCELDYIIAHTTSPACLLPSNAALVADCLGFTGPYMELRQACTGFANAVVVARGCFPHPVPAQLQSSGQRPARSISIRYGPRRTRASW